MAGDHQKAVAHGFDAHLIEIQESMFKLTEDALKVAKMLKGSSFLWKRVFPSIEPVRCMVDLIRDPASKSAILALKQMVNILPTSILNELWEIAHL